MDPSLGCIWTLEDVLETHTWLCCAGDELDSVSKRVVGFCICWGWSSSCLSTHKSLLPWCCPAVARYQPWVLGKPAVGTRGSEWAPCTTATASEMQGTCLPLPAEGLPRDFCSSPSLVKRKLQANLRAATCFGREGKKILPQPVPGEGGAGFAFIPKNHHISAEFFVSPFCVFTAQAVFTSQLSTSGIRFQFIKKKKNSKSTVWMKHHRLCICPQSLALILSLWQMSEVPRSCTFSSCHFRPHLSFNHFFYYYFSC